MKKLFLLIAVFIAVCSGLMAQTDVTSTYITNSTFDSSYDYTISSTGNFATGASSKKALSGWTVTSGTNSCAGAFEYGTAATFNLATVPTSGYDASAGGCFVMSNGWGESLVYGANATLPQGVYKYVYAINNRIAQSMGANRFGFLPTGGTGMYSSKIASTFFTLNTWVTDTVTFTLTEETAGKITMGYVARSGVGSGSSAKICIDFVKLIYYSADKTTLSSRITLAQTIYGAGAGVGASDLNTAISNAQAVNASLPATQTEVNDEVNVLQTAINTYISNNMSSLSPIELTSYIKNPSFEIMQGPANILIPGWTNVNNIVTQTNTPGNNWIKNGNVYSEKWIASGSSLPAASISQTISNLPNGIYQLTCSGHAIQQSNASLVTTGAMAFAGTSTTPINVGGDYSVDNISVTDGTLNLGFKLEGAIDCNWAGIDNFRLYYISDGAPYFTVSPSSLAFTPSVTQKTFNIKGGNLTTDINISTTPGFDLSTTTVTAAEAMDPAGATVTVTCLATSDLTNDSIILTSGTIRRKITLTLTESPITVSNKGYFFDQTITDARTLTVSGDLHSAIDLTAPVGITFSENTISKTDALAGKPITVTWDGSTRIADKYIYLTSGVKKDSVLIFAVSDNIISSWDGDNAIVAPSKLTDFGWTQTLADGVTAGTASFQEYNTGGVRYVPAASAVHTYQGKPWVGHRVAYLRTWGNPAANVYNLSVNLEAGKAYVFRGVSAWHNNELNPTFTYSVNTAKSNLGDTLGTQSVLCTVKQRGEDYGFEFTPTTTGVHYLTVSSDTKDDAMCAPDYLAIYPKHKITANLNDEANGRLLFANVGQTIEVPIVAEGFDTGIYISTDKPEWFELSDNSMPNTGGTLQVRFIGTAKGLYEGTLTVELDERGSAPGMQRISGTGTVLNITMVADITTGVSNTTENISKTFIAGNDIIAQFNLSKSTTVDMSVYNVNGMLVASEKSQLNAGANRMVLSATLPSGVYFVKLSFDGKTLINKLVK